LVKAGEAFLYEQSVTFVNGAPRVLTDSTGRPIGTLLTPASAQWQYAPKVEEGDDF
jgi:hypothetical protein